MIGRHPRKSESPDGELCQIALSVADAIRKEDRKNLQTARPKCARATEQVKSPHPPETFAVMFSEMRPGMFEIFVPGNQSRVVVWPNILDVFEHEKLFGCAHEAGGGRQHRIREDVTFDPRIGADCRRIATDSLAEEQSILA